MDTFSKEPYPGENASVSEIIELANAYYHASGILFQSAHAEAPLSYAPARMCAIHSIELYLNAFLRHQGVPPAQIRARMHNLADPAFLDALKLKNKTAQHLEVITKRREYLISRYAPEQVSMHTELNRLTATLVEIMMKVGRYLHAASQSDSK